MKINGSLPFSQHSTTCPHPVPYQFSRRSHSIPLCSILILSTHLCLGLTRSLIMKFPHQNLACISLLSHTCHMPRRFHRPWFAHSNDIQFGVEIMKLPLIQISPFSSYSVPLKPKYSLKAKSSNIISLWIPLISETKYGTHAQCAKL